MFLVIAFLVIGAAAVAAYGLSACLRNKRAAAMLPGRCELISDELLAFLEQADDAYMLAHMTACMNDFGRYAAGTVCHVLMDDLFKKPPKMFGTRKHRRRSWSVVAHDPQWILVRKRLWHEPVKAGRGFYIPLGDEMEECWTIVCRADGYQIVDVKDL